MLKFILKSHLLQYIKTLFFSVSAKFNAIFIYYIMKTKKAVD